MKYTCLSFLLIISLAGEAQMFRLKSDKKFRVLQADTLHKRIDSILIVGSGLTMTRIYLDQLSDQLEKEFKEREVVATYHYLGKSAEEVQLRLPSVDQGGYKAILFLIPLDTATFSRTKSNTRVDATSVGGPAFDVPFSRQTFEQEFEFQLCQPGTASNPFWKATLVIACSPGNTHLANKLAKKVLGEFARSGYLK